MQCFGNRKGQVNKKSDAKCQIPFDKKTKISSMETIGFRKMRTPTST